MKALCYLGEGKIQWEERPIPVLKEPTDIIVRIHKTTICGTDLHIIKGNVETTAAGRILGHEGIGTVIHAGEAVSRHKVGDRVLISCITSCGKCKNCHNQFFGHCEKGGWQLGNTIDGCQAQYVRVPHADGSAYPMPIGPGSDEDGYLMLSDIVPTGLEVGVVEGMVKEGKTVAVIGVGPVGLAAILAATPFKPARIIAVDRDANRLEVAHALGATDMIDNSDNSAAQQIMALTDGKGVEVAIEAIGTPAGWDLCENIVAAGGNIAILGVHGKPVTLHLERMWKRNFTLTAGLVHTHTIPSLMERVKAKDIRPELLISHRFSMSQMMEAYDVFSNAATHKALKVLIENDYK